MGREGMDTWLAFHVYWKVLSELQKCMEKAHFSMKTIDLFSRDADLFVLSIVFLFQGLMRRLWTNWLPVFPQFSVALDSTNIVTSQFICPTSEFVLVVVSRPKYFTIWKVCFGVAHLSFEVSQLSLYTTHYFLFLFIRNCNENTFKAEHTQR